MECIWNLVGMKNDYKINNKDDTCIDKISKDYLGLGKLIRFCKDNLYYLFDANETEKYTTIKTSTRSDKDPQSYLQLKEILENKSFFGKKLSIKSGIDTELAEKTPEFGQPKILDTTDTSDGISDEDKSKINTAALQILRKQEAFAKELLKAQSINPIELDVWKGQVINGLFKLLQAASEQDKQRDFLQQLRNLTGVTHDVNDVATLTVDSYLNSTNTNDYNLAVQLSKYINDYLLSTLPIPSKGYPPGLLNNQDPAVNSGIRKDYNNWNTNKANNNANSYTTKEFMLSSYLINNNKPIIRGYSIQKKIIPNKKLISVHASIIRNNNRPKTKKNRKHRKKLKK